MNDRPTPETDKASFSTVYQGEIVKASFARRLERERDEAQDAALEMEFRLKQAERRNVEHEHDYLAVWKAIKRPNETVLEACKRILRQRDELLGFLTKLDCMACDDEYGSSDFRKVCRYDIPKIIAAVKGGGA